MASLMRQRMPLLSQETIRFLDDADNGDPVSVRYMLTDRTETVCSGLLAGLPLDGEGNGCIAVAGLHGGRVLIQMIDVITVTGTKQPAGNGEKA